MCNIIMCQNLNIHLQRKFTKSFKNIEQNKMQMNKEQFLKSSSIGYNSFNSNIFLLAVCWNCIF